MRTILLSAAAVALCGAAVAQGQSGGNAPAGSGQQPPPMVTNPSGQPSGQRATPDGATRAPQQGATQRQPDQGGQGARQGNTQRQQDQGQGTRQNTQRQQNQRPDADTTQGDRKDTQPSGQPQRRQEQAGDQNRQNRPTASGNVSSRTLINISSPQQKTVIKNNIVRTSVAVPAGVTIAIGSALPSTLAFHPVPAAIIAVIPELEQYYYIVIDGQVVFVDPGTFEIVYILSLA